MRKGHVVKDHRSWIKEPGLCQGKWEAIQDFKALSDRLWKQSSFGVENELEVSKSEEKAVLQNCVC